MSRNFPESGGKNGITFKFNFCQSVIFGLEIFYGRLEQEPLCAIT